MQIAQYPAQWTQMQNLQLRQPVYLMQLADVVATDAAAATTQTGVNLQTMQPEVAAAGAEVAAMPTEHANMAAVHDAAMAHAHAHPAAAVDPAAAAAQPAMYNVPAEHHEAHSMIEGLVTNFKDHQQFVASRAGPANANAAYANQYAQGTTYGNPYANAAYPNQNAQPGYGNQYANNAPNYQQVTATQNAMGLTAMKALCTGAAVLTASYLL